MEEIRGLEAVRYAEREGILFNVDEEYLIRAEGEFLGRAADLRDVDNAFEAGIGRGYDPTDLHAGESFDFLVGRYGYGWAYVPLEGDDPAGEEREALRLLRRPLRERDPYCGGELLDLATRHRPRRRSTGFQAVADLNLLYHAALRLVARGKLEAVEDENPLPKGGSRSYGRRRFLVTPDVDLSVTGILCDMCLGAFGEPRPRLHRECAARLRKALAKALPARGVR